MKKFYCVTSCYDDKGGVSAAITKEVNADEKPENSYTETRRCDVYNDWFASSKEAKEFVEECRKA